MKSLHQPLITDARLPFLTEVGESSTFLRHWHDELELLYVLSGELTAVVGDTEYAARTGDIVLVGQNVQHEIRGGYVTRLLVECGSALLGDDFALAAGKRFVPPVAHPGDGPAYDALRALLDRVVAEQCDPNAPARTAALRGLLCEVYVLLIREFPMADAPASGQALLQQTRWNAVFDYIAESFDDAIGLEEAARQAGYSVYHFCRCFREHTGMSFRTYVNRYRIERAVLLLGEAGLPVTRVASQAGFDSIKTFNRVFRQETGMSPSAYREQHLHKQTPPQNPRRPEPE